MTESSGQRDRITVELDGSYRHQTRRDADPLEEFEYEIGDKFVHCQAGGTRSDDDVWAVTDVSWSYKVTWLSERDNAPTKEDHRCYRLLSRETFDEVVVSERELITGGWTAQPNQEKIN